MEKSFLEKQVRRACRNTILLCLAGIIALVGVFVVWHPNLGNLFGKPFGGKEYRDINIAYLNNQRFVDIEGMELINTGWYMTTDGKTTNYYYGAVFSDASGSRIVLYDSHKELTEAQEASFRVQGKMGRMDLDESKIYEGVIEDIMDAWELTDEQAREVLVGTFIVRQTSERLFEQAAIVAMALAALFLLGKLIRTLALLGNYRSHKLYKKVADKLDLDGDGDVDALDQAVGQEMADKSCHVLQQGNVTVTKTFAVQTSAAGLNIAKLADAAWVYPITTRHYTNGIPTGKSHSIKMCFTTGPKHDITIACRNEKQKNALMPVLADAVPSAIIGYYKELDSLYSARNFEGFKAAVEQYRTKVAAVEAAKQAPAEKEESVEDKQAEAQSGEGVSM